MTDSLRRISIPGRLAGGLVAILVALMASSVATYIAVARALGEHVANAEAADAVLASVGGSQISVFVVLLVFLGVAGWVLLRSIVPPLAEFVQSVKQLIVPVEGDGGMSRNYRIDLERRLDERGADEVTELARHINHMLASVREVVSEIQVCNGDIGTSAHTLASVTVRNREGIARQQEDTNQLATAVEQMRSAVDEVARGAASAADSTAEADRESTEGRRVVEGAGTLVAQLAREVRAAHETVSTVAEAVEKIDTVLVVINGVAEQTNLLALNAAIEAARAGDQGRGFAVVADEVRTLAQRTQTSTQEIRGIIEELQEGARAAVKRMNDSAAQAAQAQEQSSRADQALTTIAGAVSAINEMNARIAGAGEEQSATAEEVARRIKTIREVTEHAVGGARESQAVSDQLNELSDRLRALVGNFRVGTAANVSPPGAG